MNNLTLSSNLKHPFPEIINIDLLRPDPDQPRRMLEGLDDLEASIKQVGVLSPPLVRPDSDDLSRYIIVVGERRWHAAKRAGHSQLLCLVTEFCSDIDIMIIQLSEKMQRKDMTVMDTAHGIGRLIDQLGSVKTTAQMLGISVSRICEFNSIANKAGALTNEFANHIRDIRVVEVFASIEDETPQKAELLLARIKQANYMDISTLLTEAKKSERARFQQDR